MQFRAVQRVVGLLLVLFSTTMLPSLMLAFFYGDQTKTAFGLAFALTLITGFVTWFPVHRVRRDLRTRDGFLVVVLFWTVLSLFGALPFALSESLHMSVSDAIFESMSGLTTTGATVITNIDSLPKSILWYRQQLQWLGGMGIIVLAVAVLPMLGIGGMQLYRAETPGPMKDAKLTPRITETAKALWYIYLGLTGACALAYWLAGMNAFDAIGQSFSTIATGGFSTHGASMAYFQDNPLIEIIATIFMLLAAANFSLHFMAWRDMSLRPYATDSEFRVYLTVILSVSATAVGYLYVNHTFDSADKALLHGIFQAVSIGTTTGFTTSMYHAWPSFLPVLLLFTSFIVASGGSTGGGMKAIRFLLLIKQGLREIARLIHPSAIIPVKVGGKPVADRVIDSVWGFFAAYVGAFIAIALLLMATGLDQVSAFSAVAACMNNLGPGLGTVGPHYKDISDVAKWLLSFAMLLGRLEIFTLLILFSPTFWRK